MTIRKGDRGEKVMMLQAALMGTGIGLPQYGVDGIFGAETEGAVRQAQQMFNLTSTGVADSQLMELLNVDDTNTGTNRPEATGRAVWILLGLTVGAIAYGVRKSRGTTDG